MDRQCRWRRMASQAIIVLCFWNVPAWSAGPNVIINIPAGDAAQTLRQFNFQTGMELLYLFERVEGIHTQAVSGTFEASEALDLMLAGTGLEYHFETDIAAWVHPRSEHDVRQAGSAEPPNAIAGTPNSRPQIVPPSSGYGAGEMEVTGTYIRGVLDLMSPLQIITRKEMKRTAYATVQDALQTLPINFKGGLNEDFGGTGNFARSSALNLRGLGASSTLVLINGRRQPQAGLQADFVDVSNIPWSVVERVEVLPEGGSALYGSDAIAGVVNIIMRDTLDGAESQMRIGTAPDGGAEILAAQLFGRRWDTGKLLFAYQYTDRTALDAADRSYTANADKRSLGGRDHRTFSSNPGNILNPANNFLPAFAIPAGQDGTALTPGDLLPGVVNLQNQFEQFDLLPDKDMHSVFFTASQRLGERFELFAEGRFNQRSVDYRSGNAAPAQALFVPSSNPFFVDPFGGSPFVAIAYNFSKDFGPYASTARTENTAATFGLRANLTESWQATLSTAYAREHFDYASRGINTNALNASLANPDPAQAFNPFGDGSHTNPAVLDSIRFTATAKATSEIMTSGAIIEGPLTTLPAGAMRAAIGAEHRQEELDRALPGSNVIGRPPQHFGRNITAAFSELSMPLIGNPVDPRAVPRLELSLAGRYETYSDFGDTFNSAIRLRWAPWESVKFRTSWGTSFNAPKLVDLYDTSQNAVGLVPFPDPRSPSGRSIVLAQQGNHPNLTEETATTWTAGIDLAPATMRGFNLSLTYYAINYDNQVIQPGPTAITDILLYEDQWAAVITRNPSRTRVDALCNSPQLIGSRSQCLETSPAALVDFRLRNLASTHVNGLDLTLDQVLDTGLGRFNFGLNASHIFSFEKRVTTTSPIADVVDTAFNPLALRIRGTIEWNQRGQNRAGFGANITVDHTGGYRDVVSTVHPQISAWTQLDLGLRYRTRPGGNVWDNIEFTLNATNVLDAEPPFVDWQRGYDITNAIPTGLVVSLYVQKHWGSH